MMIRAIVFIFIILNLSGCGNYSNETIGPNDNGLGQSIPLIVKPDQDGTSVLKDANNNVALKWTDTNLIVSSFSTQKQGLNIGLSIVGSWYPFGSAGDNKECVFVTCDKTSDMRCNNLPPGTPIVRQTDNQGCALRNGQGIYMLIAKQINGVASDPNANAMVANSPNSADGFYTAHLNDFTTDKDGLIIVDKMWDCDGTNGAVLCKPVLISELIGGKIYLKVYDGYYGDNSADFDGTHSSVLVNIQTGVVYPNFISEAITIIVTTIDSAAQAMNHSLVQSLKGLAFISILLYLVITGFMFITGLSKITQKEAVVRLLKISIVLMFLTPNNSIAEGFPRVYQWLANLSSEIILNNMNISNGSLDTDISVGQLETNLNYLRFFDGIMNQVLSRQVNLKIIALLFSIHIYLVAPMYALILIIIYVVLQSILLYITAYIQIAILTIILPILIPAILFDTTAELFQSWLKYMANSALMIIVASAGMGIILNMMITDFSSLVSYSITKTWWWFPERDGEVGNVLNFKTYMSTLIHVFMCYSFVEYIPKLADALSGSQISLSSTAFSALSGRIGGLIGGFGRSITGTLKSINNNYLIGRLLDQRYKTNGKYDPSKEKKFNVLNKWSQIRQGIKNNSLVRLARSTYTDENTLKSEEKEYDNKLNTELHRKYQKKSAEYAEIVKTKQNEYKTAIDAKVNGIAKAYIDGTQYDLNNPGDTIQHNNIEFSKQDIRKAIDEQKDLGGYRVTTDAITIQEIQELKERQNELKNIKNELHQHRS